MLKIPVLSFCSLFLNTTSRIIPIATRATTTNITTMTTPTMIPVLPPPEGGGGVVVEVREAHVSRLSIMVHVPHRLGLLGPRQPEFTGHEEWQEALPNYTLYKNVQGNCQL